MRILKFSFDTNCIISLCFCGNIFLLFILVITYLRTQAWICWKSCFHSRACWSILGVYWLQRIKPIFHRLVITKQQVAVGLPHHHILLTHLHFILISTTNYTVYFNWKFLFYSENIVLKRFYTKNFLEWFIQYFLPYLFE